MNKKVKRAKQSIKHMSKKQLRKLIVQLTAERIQLI